MASRPPTPATPDPPTGGDRRPDRTVEVVPSDPAWPAMFEAEKALLAVAMPCALTIEHIGSTSVPGLSAKPTIDVLVVVRDIGDVLPCVDALDEIGYEYRGPFLGEEEDHVFLRKVSGGKRSHHLHVLSQRSPEPQKYRDFRDYLRSSPSAARRYERVKLDLAAAHGEDRMAYVGAKEDIVVELMAEAAEWRERGAAGSIARGTDEAT